MEKINPQIFKPRDQVFLLKGPKPSKFGDQYTGSPRNIKQKHHNKNKNKEK